MESKDDSKDDSGNDEENDEDDNADDQEMEDSDKNAEIEKGKAEKYMEVAEKDGANKVDEKESETKIE